MHQGGGYGEGALHPPGEGGEMILLSLIKAEVLEQSVHSGILLRSGNAVKPGHEEEILSSRQLIIEIGDIRHHAHISPGQIDVAWKMAS